ncbi:MAG: biotin/lipoyl-containing protein, partial [Aeromonas sp.]
MSKQIMVPDIGADEVEVTELMVAVGDRVELDQSIIAVEGDKASMEIPAPSAGIVKALLIKVGDKVVTGSAIMVFEEQQDAAPAQGIAPVSAVVPVVVTATATRQDVHVPDIGGDEVDVTEIMVAVGDMVEAEQSIMAVEGDKASMEVPAPFAGRVVEINVAIGAKVATGSLVMVFEVAGSAAAPALAPQAEPVAASVTAPVSVA